MLSFAAELNDVFSRILQKHQKAWEIEVPEKVTVTFIINSRSGHPIKALINASSEIDLTQPARS
jgi:hypothetical protein